MDTDWRDFRARLVAGSRRAGAPTQEQQDAAAEPSGRDTDIDGGRWAHSVPGPERGCLLVAHPLVFLQSQTYFNQVRAAAQMKAVAASFACCKD